MGFIWTIIHPGFYFSSLQTEAAPFPLFIWWPVLRDKRLLPLLSCPHPAPTQQGEAHWQNNSTKSRTLHWVMVQSSPMLLRGPWCCTPYILRLTCRTFHDMSVIILNTWNSFLLKGRFAHDSWMIFFHIHATYWFSTTLRSILIICHHFLFFMRVWMGFTDYWLMALFFVDYWFLA